MDANPLVLIVDDEEMNLVVLSKILQRAGYRTETAVHGKDAVQKALDIRPGLILMDLMMPVMSGWDATKALKENPDSKDIPILAVTALSNERDAALQFGFDGFCPKPIDFNNLIKLIQGFLQQTA